MMMCVSMEDPGLLIYPTHRVVRNIENFSTERIKGALNEFFEMSDMGSGCSEDSLTQKLSGSDNECNFIVYIGAEEKRAYMLKFKGQSGPRPNLYK